ncbi:MAG: LON peptidase substrate-binding domain-containing protein [Acidimicrobiales bacterium]
MTRRVEGRSVELPMFPLGSVLFPSVFLPLHIFEPRYRELVRRCLAGEREFGVVLIERGSEVGGGDVRTNVGTVARILEAAELSDGRWVLATVGVRRIRVEEWMPDEPYPRAEVSPFEDPALGPAAADHYATVRSALRRVLAARAELGEPAADATIELADDPGLGSFQVAAVAPFGPADRQRVLAVADAEGRLELLERLLAEEHDYLTRRLARG